MAELDGDKIVAVSANQKVADFFGRASNDISGRSGLELGTPEEIERLWVEQYRRSQHEGKVITFEYRDLRLADTSWLSVTVSFIGLGPTGHPRFSFVTEDITGRKYQEQRQAFLLKLSDTLNPVVDPVEMQSTLTCIVRNYFKADRCYYCEIEGNSVIIRRDASREDLPSVAGVYSLSSTPIFK